MRKKELEAWTTLRRSRFTELYLSICLAFRLLLNRRRIGTLRLVIVAEELGSAVPENSV
jgi:hypothetical protein